MLDGFPLEIQVFLLKLVPTSCLKHINSHFYLLYNDLFYNKLITEFGEDILPIIVKVYPWLRAYIKSLDTFRYQSRKAISSRLELIDFGSFRHLDTDLCDSEFIKDSWRYVYSVFKNRRLFAEYGDYRIDEPNNYVYNHYVEINRSYLLSYTKSLWLAPGTYNLNLGLVVKYGNGLGTTKFEVQYQDKQNQSIVQTFYPPTNINEILPKKQFCFLKIGEFTIDGALASQGDSGNHLVNIQLTMEEIGLYLKSGFRIFFIDVSQPSMIFNDYDLLYYSCQETDYKFFINIPLKNLYKVINYVQNNDTNGSGTKQMYGLGEPHKISEKLDNLVCKVDSKGDVSEDDKLMLYANFFFNNTINQRNFKFNTVYQRRQFINRFGDYEVDLKRLSSQPKSCTYDLNGLKWRIPIIGEL